jgi:hypothetical protein
VKCRQVLRKISAYIDDEIDSGLAREITEHVLRCRDCRIAFEETRGVDAVLKGLPRYHTPDEFAAQVLVKLQRVEAPREVQGPGRRVWRSVLKHCEGFFELIEPARAPATHSLEEFNDIPESFIGYAYFKIFG